MPDLNLGQVAHVNPSLLHAVGVIQAGQQEEILIERTLGQAFLARLQGKDIHLQGIYLALGGSDALTRSILSDHVSQAFNKLQLDVGAQAVRQQAVSDAVRASGGRKNIAASPVAKLEGQAIHTLANIAGPQFQQEFQLGD